MIFALVGTHEQQFDRLVRALDDLDTDEARIVQYGYSTYRPANCAAHKFLPFDDVRRYMEAADVVITHAGTGSVMFALSLGKRPIVAPRYAKFGEHVDDHQLQLVDSLMEDGLVVPYLDGDSLEQRIEEVKSHEQDNRAIEPDQSLVADLKRIIDES